MIYYELLEPGQTVTAESYQAQLIKLIDALEEKRPLTGKRFYSMTTLAHIQQKQPRKSSST